MKPHRWKWKVLLIEKDFAPQLSLLKCRRCNLQIKWSGKRRPRIGDIVDAVNYDRLIRLKDCLTHTVENIMNS